MKLTEVADALGVHRSRVLRFIAEGRLQAKKRVSELGVEYWDITPEEVERFKAIPRPQGWRKGRKRT